MATTVLFDAAVTLLCAILLLRHYWAVRSKLLLWAGLCFVCLAVANGLLFVDVVILPEMSLYRARLWCTAFGMSLLIYGLIWESAK